MVGLAASLGFTTFREARDQATGRHKIRDESGLPREIVKIAALPEGDKLIAVLQISRRGAGKVDQTLLDAEEVGDTASVLLCWLAIVSEAPGTWGRRGAGTHLGISPAAKRRRCGD